MSIVATHHLQIGGIIVAEDDISIGTVLGSCVSVCIFSRKHKAGAINHYALPTFDDGKGKPSHEENFRYGDQSIPHMIQALQEATGATAREFEAKIIGGASVLIDCEAGQFVGPSNIEIARRLLKAAGIRVMAEDVGGNLGRKVIFHPCTGRVQVATIDVAPGQTQAQVPVQPQPLAQKPTSLVKQSVVAARAIRRPRVLVVDDSKTIRDLLKRILSEGDELEVIGFAENPIIAEKMILQLKPDVVTLDIHMPEMDGITFLEKFLPTHPMPFVLITSISLQEGGKVLRGLELGAVDYIQKPTLQTIASAASVIREKVKSAANAKIKLKRSSHSERTAMRIDNSKINPKLILAIGASTGGTEAIREVLTRLPENIPPTVIVQHIPAVFSKAFADRLDTLCPFKVKEAEDGELLEPNKVLIAPGGLQMKLERSGGEYRIRITDDPPTNRHKPSVDYLFDSVAELIGKNAVGLVLTGMGADGAKGLLKMRNAGARTLAQDEMTSVVYGMPKAAFELGGAESVYGLEQIAEQLVQRFMVIKAA